MARVLGVPRPRLAVRRPTPAPLSVPLALGALLVGTAAAVSGQPPIPAVLVVDADADPDNTGVPSGAVFHVDEQGQVTVLFREVFTQDPVAGAFSSDNETFLLLDNTASPCQPPPGRGGVFAFQPGGGWAGHACDPRFTNLTDAAPLPDRRLLLVDPDADPLDTGLPNGALFVLDTAGEVDQIVTLPEFADPIAADTTPTGAIYLIDRSADPLDIGIPGALFLVDLGGSVDVLLADPAFDELCCVDVEADGTAWVIARRPDPDTGITMASLLRVTPTDWEVIGDSPDVALATDLLVLAPGSVLVLTDGSAAEGTRALWLWEPPAPPARLVADSRWERPLGLTIDAAGLGCRTAGPGTDCNGNGLPDACENEPCLAADLSCDGTVNIVDFTTFAACFRGSGQPCAADDCCAADFDGDGDVDIVDFTTFAACFTSGQPG